MLASVIVHNPTALFCRQTPSICADKTLLRLHRQDFVQVVQVNPVEAAQTSLGSNCATNTLILCRQQRQQRMSRRHTTSRRVAVILTKILGMKMLRNSSRSLVKRIRCFCQHIMSLHGRCLSASQDPQSARKRTRRTCSSVLELTRHTGFKIDPAVFCLYSAIEGQCIDA
jgi:hypothetical protein